MSETDQRSRNRVRVLARFGFVWAALIAARLVQLQIVNHDKFAAAAATQQTREVEVKLPRGMILDAHGAPLAMSLPVDSVTLNPMRLPDPDIAVTILSRILDLDPAVLCAQILQAKGHRPITAKVSKSASFSCAAAPGVSTAKAKGFLWIARKITPEQS